MTKEINSIGTSSVPDVAQNKAPTVKKKFFEINGGHLWMYSHPEEAAKIICDWFDETLK